MDLLVERMMQTHGRQKDKAPFTDIFKKGPQQHRDILMREFRKLRIRFGTHTMDACEICEKFESRRGKYWEREDYVLHKYSHVHWSEVYRNLIQYDKLPDKQDVSVFDNNLTLNLLSPRASIYKNV